MLDILYEDTELIVAVKPAGLEAQAARRFAPDMVSALKKHMVINKTSTPGREPYVAVIHRLDKPVSGIMVYAKTKTAAAALSLQLQRQEMKKVYEAVVCGKPLNYVDNYVDYLLKDGDKNISRVVHKGTSGAKRAELSFTCIKCCQLEGRELSLLKIRLKTGRHHQIRVQLAAHGLPLYGDARYDPETFSKEQPALCACSLAFFHPKTNRQMEFSIRPLGMIFEKIYQYE
ncbi:MAG: RluA family pseudouridine synthase [Lachnospiraceae bacterium]|nr:RluA family pseudouridine synthase [Lachnospiraceae bacterium]